jgi:transposase-like protein
MPEDEKELAVRLYRDTRLPSADIGQLVGVSRQTVHNWVRAAGVPLRGARSGGPMQADAATGDVFIELRIAMETTAAAINANLMALTARVGACEASIQQLIGLVRGTRP